MAGIRQALFLYPALAILGMFPVTCQRGHNERDKTALRRPDHTQCNTIVTGRITEQIASHITSEGDEFVIYIFDDVSGGLRLVEPLYDRFDNALDVAREMLVRCTNCAHSQRDEGCIACVRTPMVNENLVLSRSGCLSLLNFLRKRTGTTPNNVYVGDRFRERFGEELIRWQADDIDGFANVLFPPGSEVVDARGKLWRVLSSEPHGRDRIYRLSDDCGATSSFLGVKLNCVSGDVAKWCTTCGWDQITIEATKCPECGGDV